MKKLICLALSVSLILTFSGCNGKQAEFEPVEGFEKTSDIVYSIVFGESYEELKKTDAHKIPKFYANFSDYNTKETYEHFPDYYTRAMYFDESLSRNGVDGYYYIGYEFLDDKLVCANFSLNQFGGSEDEVLDRQEEIIAAYSSLAENMGFAKQESISHYRFPFVIYEGLGYSDAHKLSGIGPCVSYLGSTMIFEDNNPARNEYLESESYSVPMSQDIIYYLSEDGTKVLAISPYDVFSHWRSIYIPGDEIYTGDTKETYELSGYPSDMRFAPVYVTYYDVSTITDIIEKCNESGEKLVYYSGAWGIELLKEVEDIGIPALREKYKDSIDFLD